jgi:hypothetical protein
VLKAPHPLCFISFSVPCLLFSFFFKGMVKLSRGLCWFYPRGAIRVLCATYLLTCWSTFPRQVKLLVMQEPSWFLSVMWHGDDLCGLGVQGVGVSLLLVGFSCQV